MCSLHEGFPYWDLDSPCRAVLFIMEGGGDPAAIQCIADLIVRQSEKKCKTLLRLSIDAYVSLPDKSEDEYAALA